MNLISKILLLLPVVATACSHEAQPEYTDEREPVNSVYFWKTVFDIDSAENDFLRRHAVGRIYLRMFDVAADPYGVMPDDKAVPNATVRFNYSTYDLLTDTINPTEIIPVVYITLDALRAMKDSEGVLATNIVTRVRNMCEYHQMANVRELQLDCDWTVSTEQSFFTLCDSVKHQFAELELPWELSSTIRLHQLARSVPPVDRGVLMVYNTGNFDDPDAANSIIDPAVVKPYLKRLGSYNLPLDVAYPTYSWQLLFSGRKFIGLTNGVNISDSTRFAPRGTNSYVALTDVPHSNTIIRAGDVVRQETSEFADIAEVKTRIDRILSEKPHSTILYHLDSSNLSKFSADEIDRLYSPAN